MVCGDVYGTALLIYSSYKGLKELNARNISQKEIDSKFNPKGKPDAGGGDYKAPKGGGGMTDNIKIGNKEVTFGHGGRHLDGTNLSANEVNQVIANDVITKNPGTGKFYKGQVKVNGVNI